MRTNGTFTFRGKRVSVTSTDPIEGIEYGEPWSDNPNGWAHYAYKVTIKWVGRQYTFPYKRGIGNDANNIPVLEALASIAIDARAYWDNPSFWDFVDEFGYSQDESDPNFDSEYWGYSNARKAYLSCKKTAINLDRVFRGHLEEFLSDSRLTNY